MLMHYWYIPLFAAIEGLFFLLARLEIEAINRVLAKVERAGKGEEQLAMEWEAARASAAHRWRPLEMVSILYHFPLIVPYQMAFNPQAIPAWWCFGVTPIAYSLFVFWGTHRHL